MLYICELSVLTYGFFDTKEKGLEEYFKDSSHYIDKLTNLLRIVTNDFYDHISESLSAIQFQQNAVAENDESSNFKQEICRVSRKTNIDLMENGSVELQ